MLSATLRYLNRGSSCREGSYPSFKSSGFCRRVGDPLAIGRKVTAVLRGARDSVERTAFLRREVQSPDVVIAGGAECDEGQDVLRRARFRRAYGMAQQLGSVAA